MIFHDVRQNTEEWDFLRLGKATGSNFGCFMANYGKAFGDPAKDYALRLALERINGVKAEFGFSNEHTERGHEQEPIARMLYEEQYFAEISNGGFFDHGDYGDSPDGLIGDTGVIEIKSVIAKTHYANMLRGKFDPAYKWQMVGHLDCTKREWVDFTSYCSDFPKDKQLLVFRSDRDDFKEELKMLEERRYEFLKLVNEVEQRIRVH